MDEVVRIWAMGVGQDDLCEACEGFLRRIDAESSRVPVLVTDFAYFSRLQWLVGSVPELSGEGSSFSLAIS